MLVSGDFQIFRWRSEKKLSHFPHLYPLYYHILQPCPTPSLGVHPSMRMNGFWGVWAAVWYSRCGVVDMVWCGVLVCVGPFWPLSAEHSVVDDGCLSSFRTFFGPRSTFLSTINFFVHNQHFCPRSIWSSCVFVEDYVVCGLVRAYSAADVCKSEN